MRFRNIIAVLAVALTCALPCESKAQTAVNVTPVTTVDVAIVTVGAVTAKSIATLISEQYAGGLTAKQWGLKGRSGFKIAVLSTTERVCMGGSGVTTSLTAGSGRCWPVCVTGTGNAATCIESVSPVRGTLETTFLIASGNTTVYVLYGSTTGVGQ